VPIAELGVDRLDLGGVLVAFEGRRDRRLQLLDERAQVIAQLAPAARRQLQRERPVRRGEVVDVRPVGRAACPRAPR
jgi:hypothetical protein